MSLQLTIIQNIYFCFISKTTDIEYLLNLRNFYMIFKKDFVQLNLVHTDQRPE
jgi:hypothetical protein